MSRATRYCEIVLERRWLVAAVSILFLLLTAAGGPDLKVTTDGERALFGEDNQDLAAWDRMQDIYASSNTAIIAVSPKQAGEDMFSRTRLAALEQIEEQLWHTPHSLRVDSLTGYYHTDVDGDDLTVDRLVTNAMELEPDEIARIRAIATESDELVGRLVSREGHVAAFMISFALPQGEGTNANEVKIEVWHYLRDLLAEARNTYPDLEFYLTGSVILGAATHELTLEGLTTLAPIALLVILIVSIVLLRSFFGMLAIFIVVICTLASNLGIAGWANVLLTPNTSAHPLMILTIAVAYTNHIVTSVYRLMREGRTRYEAIAEAMQINMHPITIAAVTTSIGFLSLNMDANTWAGLTQWITGAQSAELCWVGCSPFASLGNLSAIGILCLFIYSVTLLPVLLSFLPVPDSVTAEREDVWQKFGAFVVRQRKRLFASFLLAAIILTMGVTQIGIDNSFIRYFDEEHEFRVDAEFITTHLSGINSIDYSLDSGETGGVSSVVYLDRVERFANWYRAQPGVRDVTVYTDIIKRLNRNMNGDDPDQYRLPETAELAGQYLLLYEFSLPFGADLNDRINLKKSATRMSVVLDDITSTEIVGIDLRAQAWLQENMPEIATAGAGHTIASAKIAESVSIAMLMGIGIALGIISVILLVMFRSVRYGVIALIPNCLPIIMGFGIWGYFLGYISLSGSIVAAIVFGVVIDDTVHFLSKYKKSRALGMNSSESVKRTFVLTGQALFNTTVILVAGFLTFGISDFETTWTMGYAVAIMAATALIADFLFLPTLLMMADKDEESSAEHG